jgi:Flp pilus assembly protein TadG
MTKRMQAILRDDRGQILPLVAVTLIATLGMAAFVCDIGRALYVDRQLQNSANAAALAGAQQLPSTNAVSQANTYSGQQGDHNASGQMGNVTMVSGYPEVLCLTTLQNQGMSCSAPANGNAVRVEEQVTVPMIFASLFGQKSITLTAMATAASGGSGASPANVAIVLDTTASMNDQDSDSNCSNTRISCALGGVQTLLSKLSPCGSATSCGTATSGNVANAVDEVALYTFPGLSSTSQQQYDYNCSGTNPTIAAYTYPTPPTYQVINFSSDYRTSTEASSLAGTSNLVAAVGGKTNCSGMQAPGGEGTYYAGVIYATQAALVASARPNAQNVMIILSDGDANATSAHMTSNNTKGTYPSTVDQCHQAVTAAQAATAAGTKVYTVAYGAESSGCATDTPAITPCQTMQQMASAPQYFYSDYTATGGASTCVSASNPITGLNSIFNSISQGAGMTAPRLIPNSVT